MTVDETSIARNVETVRAFMHMLEETDQAATSRNIETVRTYLRLLEEKDKGPGERNVASVRRFLRLLEEKDIESWSRLWAVGADHYYPYGTEMFPPHIVGREAIYQRWRDVPGMFETMSFPLRETWVDGDTVIARFDSECVLKGGRKYRNTYIGIFTFDRDGLIKRYWEYFDPIQAGVEFGLADVRYTRPT